MLYSADHCSGMKPQIIFTRTLEYNCMSLYFSFPGGSDGKESACNAGDLGSIPGLERSPAEGNGNPLQYSCLESSMDTRAWWAAFCGVTKNTTEQLIFSFLNKKLEGKLQPTT